MISVVMCTHNPSDRLLGLSLGSIARQNMPAEDFEFIIVDNRSHPPLDKATLEKIANRPINLVREERPGLTYARVAGIRTAKSDLIVFIDDDNELAPDYLTCASRIADEEPHLGVFGGKCLGAFETEISALKKPLLPFLGVRDVGDEPLTGAGAEWGPYEPIGAGIVARRPIAELYVGFVESAKDAGGLGRKGNQLLAGEDSLFSRLAFRAGYQCGYRPQLSLYHHIEARRLDWRYLARLMQGHGVSYVRLAALSGKPISDDRAARMRVALFKNFVHRVRSNSWVEAVYYYYWDLGYFEALAEPQDHPALSMDDFFRANGSDKNSTVSKHNF